MAQLGFSVRNLFKFWLPNFNQFVAKSSTINVCVCAYKNADETPGVVEPLKLAL
jgi:hypothetical protein